MNEGQCFYYQPDKHAGTENYEAGNSFFWQEKLAFRRIGCFLCSVVLTIQSPLKPIPILLKPTLI